ncbi:MAG: hypothetical protein J2P17_07815, partial [Mycobacterium sp.]|nr:hypothetical protein [Mycobacterium sp.]
MHVGHTNGQPMWAPLLYKAYEILRHKIKNGATVSLRPFSPPIDPTTMRPAPMPRTRIKAPTDRLSIIDTNGNLFSAMLGQQVESTPDPQDPNIYWLHVVTSDNATAHRPQPVHRSQLSALFIGGNGEYRCTITSAAVGLQWLENGIPRKLRPGQQEKLGLNSRGFGILGEGDTLITESAMKALGRTVLHPPKRAHIFHHSNGKPHAAPRDIIQGALGDCGYLGSLGSLAANNPRTPPAMLYQYPNYTFVIRFMDRDYNPRWQPITTDLWADAKCIPLYAFYDHKGNGKNTPLWPALFEKALATKQGGDYMEINGVAPARTLDTLLPPYKIADFSSIHQPTRVVSLRTHLDPMRWGVDTLHDLLFELLDGKADREFAQRLGGLEKKWDRQLSDNPIESPAIAFKKFLRKHLHPDEIGRWSPEIEALLGYLADINNPNKPFTSKIAREHVTDFIRYLLDSGDTIVLTTRKFGTIPMTFVMYPGLVGEHTYSVIDVEQHNGGQVTLRLRDPNGRHPKIPPILDGITHGAGGTLSVDLKHLNKFSRLISHGTGIQFALGAPDPTQSQDWNRVRTALTTNPEQHNPSESRQSPDETTAEPRGSMHQTTHPTPAFAALSDARIHGPSDQAHPIETTESIGRDWQHEASEQLSKLTKCLVGDPDQSGVVHYQHRDPHTHTEIPGGGTRPPYGELVYTLGAPAIHTEIMRSPGAAYMASYRAVVAGVLTFKGRATVAFPTTEHLDSDGTPIPLGTLRESVRNELSAWLGTELTSASGAESDADANQKFQHIVKTLLDWNNYGPDSVAVVEIGKRAADNPNQLEYHYAALVYPGYGPPKWWDGLSLETSEDLPQTLIDQTESVFFAAVPEWHRLESNIPQRAILSQPRALLHETDEMPSGVSIAYADSDSQSADAAHPHNTDAQDGQPDTDPYAAGGSEGQSSYNNTFNQVAAWLETVESTDTTDNQTPEDHPASGHDTGPSETESKGKDRLEPVPAVVTSSRLGSQRWPNSRLREPERPAVPPLGDEPDTVRAWALQNLPDLFDRPRTLEQLYTTLAPILPNISFEDLQGLREQSYRDNRTAPPTVSRQNLDAFLANIWDMRDEMTSADDIYQAYLHRGAAEPAENPAAYFDELVRILTEREAGNPKLAVLMHMGERLDDILTPDNAGNWRTENVALIQYDRTNTANEAPWTDAGYKIFVNTSSAARPLITARIVHEVIDNPARFPGIKTVKTSGPLEVRVDGIVIYARDRAAVERVTDWLRTVQADHTEWFRWDVPAGSEQLLSGIAFAAEHPRWSFGAVQAGLIASALARHSNGTWNGFHADVLDSFRLAGKDPDRVHLNLVSTSHDSTHPPSWPRLQGFTHRLLRHLTPGTATTHSTPSAPAQPTTHRWAAIKRLITRTTPHTTHSATTPTELPTHTDGTQAAAPRPSPVKEPSTLRLRAGGQAHSPTVDGHAPLRQKHIDGIR